MRGAGLAASGLIAAPAAAAEFGTAMIDHLRPVLADPLLVIGAVAVLAVGCGLIVRLAGALRSNRRLRLAAQTRDDAIDTLRESGKLFKNLTQISPVGVFFANAAGECLYSNERMHRLTGRPARDLAGTGWHDALHPDDRDMVISAWRAAAESSSPFHQEFRLQSSDGNVAWVLCQAEVHREPDSDAAGFVCTVTDITERKQAETALAESERRLSNAQRLARTGSWERDLASDVIEWSDQVYAIYGMGPHKVPMTFQRFLETVHPDDRAEMKRSVPAVVESGEEFSKVHRIIRPDGEVRTVRQLGEVIRNSEGRAVRFVGTVQDITDLRRTEDSLRRSEERFRTMFESGGTGMVVTDLSGRYRRVNRAFCDFVGYSENDLLAMNSRDLTHEEERAEYDENYQKLLSGAAGVLSREKRYVRSDGETVWAIITAAVFHDAVDDETYLISNVQDISERKLAEQALARSESLLLEAQKIANVGNWERDLETSRITWSDQMYEIFGIERGDFDGDFETLLGMVHPDDRHLVVRRREMTGAQQDFRGSGFRIVRPDGEIRHVRIERRLQTDASGKPIRAVGILQDVTELHVARVALGASEARFRSVFESGGAGIVVADEDGRLQQTNQAFEDFVGYDRDDLVDMTIFDVIHVADHDALRRNRDGLFSGARSRVSAEHRFAHKDGGTRWANVSAAAMVGPSDHQKLMILTMQDVTQRKLADEELASKTALIDLVREVALAANNATDFNQVVEFCLGRVCAVAGWAVGHAYLSTGRDDDVEPMEAWYVRDPDRFGPFRTVTEELPLSQGHGIPRAVLEHGGFEWRERIPARPGDPGPRAIVAMKAGLVSGFAAPVLAGDDVVAVLEFFSDKPISKENEIADTMQQIGTELGRVYERQRAETALRRREEQLSQIIDNAPLWIFVKDREGRYLLVNKAMAAAYGRSPEQVVGRTQDELYDHPEELVEIRKGDRYVIEHGVARTYSNAKFHTTDGGTRALRIVKVPFTTRDGGTAVLGLAADITDETRAEAELRRALRMDALGHMTGGVAHDFNNLLTIILGNLQLLDRRMDDDKANRLLVQTAARAARRGAQVTGRLLAFARSQPLEPRPVNANSMIDDMIDLVERTLGVGIEIECRMADDLWMTMADPAQVENALINLVANARDAMPEGGRLTLSTANTRLGKSSAVRREAGIEPGDFVCLAVQDTGTGMNDDVAARALEPFFTTKPVGKGSGLGLSTIYGFARQSGGGVRIQTTPGKGTKVAIFLPRCEPAERQEAESPGDIAGGHGESVLLVEDDPDIRAFAAQALDNLNYRVFQAGDAAAAMKALDETDGIDVMFTDIVLPGAKDGRALAEQAQRRRPGLKVVLTSGNWDLAGGPPAPGDIPGAANLQKPYTESELGTILRSVLENGPAKRVGT